MATIKDVARQAGVSVTTVSRVLNETAPVNEKTKKNVLKVIEELRYSPSMMAQGMRTKKSKTLGIIIPDYINSFYYELFKDLEDAARKHGYNILVTSIGEGTQDKTAYLSDLVNRNVDGLVVCTYQGDKASIEYLLKLAETLPVVFIDHLNLDKPVNTVYTDGYAGIKKIVQHLYQLGHREMAYITSIPRYKVNNDRYQGFADALREYGLPLRPELVYEGNYHIESGYEAARHFFTAAPVRPTAIVSATDLMAIGAINYLKSMGLKIPEDVAVTGFDDIHMSRWISPPVTTCRQPLAAMAEQAVELFLHRSRHPHAKVKRIIFEGELMIRRSTDPAKEEFVQV
ncbi:laci bacterial regulatory protein hth signature [Lucifera butyrica]|uniref:Laci bacterial regulatory protein hth signature n=1 Tax=Lucifera butyrica TaxID=1351585 RepID=A0A498R1V2_9FIRM|nr:LacI family DNA-binding transcriptional regulator [Lucifera butyrica]VBB06596.1 laci bacterial regulatory protein hth signature [Lucifera butyrica]